MMMINKKVVAVIAMLAFAGIFCLGCGSRFKAPEKQLTREEKLPELKHDEIFVRGEILSIPAKVSAKLDIEYKGPLTLRDPFTDSDFAELYRKNPDIRLLLQPRLMMNNGEDGTFQIMIAPKKPFQELYLRPLIQADGLLQLDGKFAMIAGSSMESSMESLNISRKIQPNTGHYECFGPIKIENANVYVFLNVNSGR